MKMVHRDNQDLTYSQSGAATILVWERDYT